MTNKEKVLTELRKYPVGEKISYSFCALSQNLGISKKELDSILRSLEIDRYIDQWTIENDDQFIISVR
jgi:hypothetical protein